MDVFLTSPWIPAEWIRAHGLVPRGIWAAENFQPGAQPLSAGVCAFAEATVRFAEARTDSAVIFSTACDQMRRGFDAVPFHGQLQPPISGEGACAERDSVLECGSPLPLLRTSITDPKRQRAGEVQNLAASSTICGNPRAFLFNLPATWQTPAAKEMFHAELERLGQFLLTIGGHAPSLERLRQEMEQSSATRKRLLESAPASSPRGFAEAVARFHWDGFFPPPPPAAPTNQVPIALVGGPFLASHWKLLDEIEAAGGRVVLNATKTGERSLCPAFESEADTDNPFDVLVHGYCDNIVDVFQRPNTRLYSWLKPRLASRQVRGIVLWHFTGCDLWRAEAQTLRETFGLPVLLLEASDEPGNTPRELTRLQAFVETLNDAAFRGCDASSQRVSATPSSREPLRAACDLPIRTGDEASPSPSATGRRSHE